jgi:hypothetical protein
MKILSGVMATTHIDRHFERMALSALEGMAEQTRESYIPLIWNHDLRYPPLGRVLDARVSKLSDGEWALESDGEYWEPCDSAEACRGDGRRMRVEAEPHDGLYVAYDRSFVQTNDGDRVREIAKLLGNEEPQFQGKKALEPISTLVIGGGLFVAGSIAAGFFGKLGSDAYDRLKERLKTLYGRSPDSDRILDFKLGVAGDNGAYEVHVLVVGPDASQIDSVLDSRFAGLDELLLDMIDREADLARVVTIWRDGSISLAYAVRGDAFPVEVNWENIPSFPEAAGQE